eukprot:8448723-Heterocapsa_arctica.AAC.1
MAPRDLEMGKPRSRGKEGCHGPASRQTSPHGTPQGYHGPCTKTRSSCFSRKRSSSRARSGEQKARPTGREEA